MKTRFFVLAGIVGMALGAGSQAVMAESSGGFYGKIYADWYYDLGDSSPAKQPITKKSEIELSRVYMGYKYTIDDKFIVDALLDVERADPVKDASVSGDPGGVSISLSKDTRYFAFLKAASLSWKNIVPFTTLTLGQMGCYAFNVQEKFWGHRYLYKSLMDQAKWEHSADLGVSATFSPVDLLKITAGVFNGEGYKAPQDADGNYRPALGVQVNPVKDFMLYLYYDWMPFGSTFDTPQHTIAVFAGYDIVKKVKIGVEYDAQLQQKGVEDNNVSGLSIVGMYSIIEPLEIFARFDLLSSKDDWNVKQDGRAIIAGVQFKPVSKVKFALDYQHSMLKVDDAIGSNRIYIHGEFDY